ncbi:MAG: hypothetical protein WC686_05210 [Candidatus Shapirobacteria bacterium]|jgi:hypothetical protein
MGYRAQEIHVAICRITWSYSGDWDPERMSLWACDGSLGRRWTLPYESGEFPRDVISGLFFFGFNRKRAPVLVPWPPQRRVAVVADGYFGRPDVPLEDRSLEPLGDERLEMILKNIGDLRERSGLDRTVRVMSLEEY